MEIMTLQNSAEESLIYFKKGAKTPYFYDIGFASTVLPGI
jgi:hypothetical protein